MTWLDMCLTLPRSSATRLCPASISRPSSWEKSPISWSVTSALSRTLISETSPRSLTWSLESLSLPGRPRSRGPPLPGGLRPFVSMMPRRPPVRFDHELKVRRPDPELVAVADLDRFQDEAAVDLRPLVRLQVADQHPAVAGDNPAVGRADTGLAEPQMTRGTAPDQEFLSGDGDGWFPPSPDRLRSLTSIAGNQPGRGIVTNRGALPPVWRSSSCNPADLCRKS